MTSVTPRSISAITSGCSASSASDAASMPCCFAHAGATSGSSTTSAATNGSLVADGARLADERDRSSSAASRLAGLMFLPPAVMISSFLRSTML